ncbi:MAG: hypothetical protein NT001_03230 [Candidatus Woesearchaeota archaeon]|nr:hypothetical protein [Candidatus Woesearchaeota archaeon]
MVNIKRKVIKQGNGTLTITLPKGWTDDIGLTGNDEVDITPNQNNLIVTPNKPQKQKKISIDVDKFERLSFAKFLIACYEQGFDTIDMHFTKSHVTSWRGGKEDISKVINFFVTRLIGFEVLSQTKNRVSIGNISEKYLKFDSILSRIFFLIEEYFTNLINAFETNDYASLKESQIQHDNITKLIALGSRIIYDSPEFSKVEAMNLVTILNLLDKITDFIRDAYRNTSLYNKKISRNTLDLAVNAFKFLELYRHFFNKFSYEEINKLDDLRGEVKDLHIQCVAKVPKESAINSNFDALVDTLHGAIKPRIALELAKGKLGN